MIPAYVAFASSVILLLHIVSQAKLFRKLLGPLSQAQVSADDVPPEELPSTHLAGFFAEAKDHVLKHGGLAIFAYKLARLIGCLAFLGLSLATLILEEKDTNKPSGLHMYGKWGKKPKNKRGRHDHLLSEAEWRQAAMCASAVSVFRMGCVTCSTIVQTAVCFPARFDLGIGQTSVGVGHKTFKYRYGHNPWGVYLSRFVAIGNFHSRA